MSRKSFKVIDVILADDVRQERNNKLLVVGMYSGSVIVPPLPVVLPSLAFVTKWWTADGSLPAGTYKVLDPRGQVVIQVASAAFKAESPTPFLLAINRFVPVRLEQEGPHRWMFTPEGGRARRLAEFVVLVAKQVMVA